jgi:glycosyltransferase A (GT-A) superfamily protein (DUF2064 family)
MTATDSDRSDRRPARSRTAETTLLVFTLGARGEGRRKRLLPAALRDRETALYRACFEEALAAGRGAGCRLEVCSPADVELPDDALAVGQAGRGFGERFAGAFDSALARSAGPVVAVGTDTPGLAREHVERALTLLDSAAAGRTAPRDAERDTVVIGPSPDGGLYLLASSRPLGDLLRRVRWCRGTTLAQLRRQLHRAGLEVVLLDPLADLDRRQDLERWVAHSWRYRRSGLRAPSRAIERAARAIAHVLLALRRPLRPHALGLPVRTPAPVHRGRAPPLALSA